MYKTYQPKQKEVVRNWHLVNAKDQVLGRMATQIATLLMGKHKPEYSRHLDVGDFVVVVNAVKVEVTGQKREKTENRQKRLIAEKNKISFYLFNAQTDEHEKKNGSGEKHDPKVEICRA